MLLIKRKKAKKNSFSFLFYLNLNLEENKSMEKNENVFIVEEKNVIEMDLVDDQDQKSFVDETTQFDDTNKRQSVDNDDH